MVVYEPPVPVRLPKPPFSFRARRALATAGTFGLRMASATLPPGKPAPARGVRQAFEELGATYVKFGQLIASAPAVLPEWLVEEFRSTLDSGPPVPYEKVRRIVEKELERPSGELFESFEPEPFAAASIATVHRATLPGGRRVAVKVIRPRISAVVAADLDLMEPFFRFVARQGSNAAYNAVSYLIGLREQIAEEVDLRNEVRTMAYFRGLFEQFGLNCLVIPEVVESHSGRRVLTMEYLEGVPIDDLPAADRMGVDPRPMVEELLRAWVLTALRAGAFHADIHAGNLLLLKDGRLGMLDWGIVARLDPRTREFFHALVRAAIGEDEAWDAITEHVRFTQGPVIEGMGLEAELPNIVRQYIEPVLTRPLKDVSMAAMFMPPERAAEMNHGIEIPKRSLRENWQLNRMRARTFQRSLDDEVLSLAAQRANFLSAKQLLYLERYGRMYMPDESLLGDHEFLRAVLAMDRVDA